MLYGTSNMMRLALLAGAAFVVMAPGLAQAETIEGALARAYAGNPTLNAQRGGVRATDESVPQALGGYRPTVRASGDVGATVQDERSGTGRWFNDKYVPRGAGLEVDQNLFNGFKTTNQVRQADAAVLSQRETLRSTEQQVLFDGVNAYMDVLRDTAIVDLRKNNVDVLQEQLRQTRDRFNVGEVTRTDVAQAEARLAAAQADVSTAIGNLKGSLAHYRAVIGVEAKQLAPARALDSLLPRTLDSAVAVSQSEHPDILRRLHDVDTAELAVKIAEADLYPSLGVAGTVTHRWDYQQSNRELNQATVVGTLSVPIYEGGIVYSRVRQAKEQLGVARTAADQARDQIRQNVVTAWGVLEATKERITASQAQIQAAEVALNGVREEAKVGQRTTLDVLNAQQELLSARVSLITAQRDRVVASYAVLSAVGRLSAGTLRLPVTEYQPRVHYEQVRDKWIGLRNPDGQ